MTTSNGDIYKGKFKNGLPNGKATITFTNGDIYEGDFYNGSPNGQGILQYKNGDTYEGDFIDSLPNGIVFKISNGHPLVFYTNGEE